MILKMTMYVVLELSYLYKRIIKTVYAWVNGYPSHSARMTSMLRNNIRVYEGSKHSDGYFYNGSVHSWSEAKLY